MAGPVTILGVTDNPFMPRLMRQPDPSPGALAVKARLDEMRERLAARVAKPRRRLRPEWSVGSSPAAFAARF